MRRRFSASLQISFSCQTIRIRSNWRSCHAGSKERGDSSTSAQINASLSIDKGWIQLVVADRCESASLPESVCQLLDVDAIANIGKIDFLDLIDDDTWSG